jgi:catechol 2,3-dioxygenase-like lactoylglutathione lyase family enzyme
MPNAAPTDAAPTSMPMLILYVDSPQRSAAFYEALLARAPVETSPTFAMLALGNGVMLGLWSRHTVEPAAAAAGGGGELAFRVADEQSVLALHDAWRARDIPVLQAPLAMDFGVTVVGLDPDGHRLRVFAPAD